MTPKDTPTTSTTAPVAAPKKTRKFPTWLLVVAGLIIVIVIMVVIILTIVNTATKDAVKVSDQLISDIQANKPEDAYGLTSPVFQKATSQDELAQIFDSTSPALQGAHKITNKSVQKSSGKNEQAIIIYTIDAPNGTRYVRVVLQKDSSKWQVVNFRSSETPLTTNEAN